MKVRIGSTRPSRTWGGAMPAAGGCGAGARCGGGSCWSWPGLTARRSGTRSARASASQPGIPQRRWGSAWRRAKRSWPRYSAISSRRRWMSTAAVGAVATGAGTAPAQGPAVPAPDLAIRGGGGACSRFGPCRCGVACRRSVTPVAEIMPDRCTPEYERVVAAMGAALPYRRALALLEAFFPLGDAPAVETTRQRTLQVGARLERAALAPPQPPAAVPAAGSIALGIDGGHVRSVRRYQVRSFEVFVAQVSGDEGRSVVFSSVPAEADRQQQQLRGVLHRLGATPSTPVTILSDGADGPRSLGEAACTGPTSHVLDWFHLAMRIQHVAQAAKGWPADTPGKRADKARLADAVERIRWRLWHGQVQRALDLIGETLTWLEGMAEAALTAAAKATALLRGLETYVSGQADLIIDYATAQRRDEPISTATTEGTVQCCCPVGWGPQPADAL